jgi:hypothetical protein
VALELADILIHLIRCAERLDLDLVAAAYRKTQIYAPLSVPCRQTKIRRNLYKLFLLGSLGGSMVFGVPNRNRASRPAPARWPYFECSLAVDFDPIPGLDPVIKKADTS